MRYTNLEFFLSQPRLDRFLIAAGNDKKKARKLYNANLRLAQSFYPVLNLLEISLRNSIDDRLSTFFLDPNWIINQRNGFMNDRRIRVNGQFYLKNQVNRAENKLLTRGLPPTAGRLIAEQTLGFWITLFDSEHYRLLRGDIIHCFPNKPKPINRRSLWGILNNIREFRNRIYHNEPICFNGHSFNLSNAKTIKTDIFNLASWMEPSLGKYFQKYNGIDSAIRKAENI